LGRHLSEQSRLYRRQLLVLTGAGSQDFPKILMDPLGVIDDEYAMDGLKRLGHTVAPAIRKGRSAR
jgi:hypothetical protein